MIACICLIGGAADGGALAQSARRTGKFIPLSRLEPPRDVAAAQWTSLYCSRWDDGCVQCERRSSAEKARCEPMEAAGAACTRKLIACSQDAQEPGFRSCASVMWARPLFDAYQNIAGYHVEYCNPGRCERPGDFYFAQPKHAKILDAYREHSSRVWVPTDRASSYCVDSFARLCREPAMRGIAPCGS